MNTKERLGYMAIGGILVLVGLCLASVLPLGAQSEDEKFGEITCTRLTVLSPDGNPAVLMHADGEAGAINVWAPDGKSGVRLDIDDEKGGNVYVYGKGESSVMLGITGNGGFVSVDGQDGKSAATLSIEEYGGQVSVRDEDGKRLGALGVDEQGGEVTVYSKFRETIAMAILGVTEDGGLVMLGSNKMMGATIFSHESGGGLVIENKAGTHVVGAGVNDMAGGFMFTSDKHGDRTGTMP